MLGALVAGVVGAAGAIVEGAVSVSEGLAIVGLAIQGLKAIGNVIVCLAKALGIIKPELDVEDLGDRAMQAEEMGIKPEQFDSYEEWVRKIEKDDWGYDPEKNKGIDPKEKVAEGIKVASGVAIERFADLPMVDFLILSGTNKDFFTMDRMKELGDLANSDPEAFGKVVSYVTGAAKDRTAIGDATDILMDIEKTLQPGMDDGEAYRIAASFYEMK